MCPLYRTIVTKYVKDATLRGVVHCGRFVDKERVFLMRTSDFLFQKTFDFSKITVCPHRY